MPDFYFKLSQVPQSRHFLDASGIKPEIKLEAEDGHTEIYNAMDCMVNNSSDVTYNKNYPSFLENIKNVYGVDTVDQSRSVTVPTTLTSSTAMTTMPSFFSSSASLLSLSPFSSTTSASTYTTTKTSTYVTELAGSGCTVVSNTDFLFNSTNTMSPFDAHDDSLEYTDLDKPMEPLNDDYGPYSTMSKQGSLSDESNSVPLEAIFLMTDTIKSDCDNLNVPYGKIAFCCVQFIKPV